MVEERGGGRKRPQSRVPVQPQAAEGHEQHGNSLPHYLPTSPARLASFVAFVHAITNFYHHIYVPLNYNVYFPPPPSLRFYSSPFSFFFSPSHSVFPSLHLSTPCFLFSTVSFFPFLFCDLSCRFWFFSLSSTFSVYHRFRFAHTSKKSGSIHICLFFSLENKLQNLLCRCYSRRITGGIDFFAVESL